MDWYTGYKLVKDGDNYNIIINLNPNSEEFSTELGTKLQENLLSLDHQIKKFVKEKFPDIKVNAVKLMLGSLIVASIPFMNPVEAKAADINTSTTQVAKTANLNTTGLVTASRLNVRGGPSTGYSVIHILWQWNRVKVIGQSSGWYKIQLSDGRVGWVSSTYLKLDNAQEKINKVIYNAKSLLGTPYVWGGESPSEGGFDCSGLTQYVFKQSGYTLNRISSAQATQGIYVSRQNLKPGDLVFYSFEGTSNINHVGIYIGNNQMIHSPKAGDVVKTTDISTSYWESRFVTARRIIYLSFNFNKVLNI